MTAEAPRKTGKWLRDDVPHFGWTCTEVVEGGPLCDMCEVTHIVYAHVMTHPQYPGWLECGYVCAGFMTDGPEVELVRELLYKWRRAQEKTPIEKLRRKNWHRTSYTDGSHGFAWSDQRRRPIEAQLNVSVKIENCDGWRYRLFFHNGHGPQLSSNAFLTVEAAALAGIEHAELLMADPLWQAADCEARAEHWAVRAVEKAASERRDDAKVARWMGNEDLAIRVESGQISHTEFLTEYHRIKFSRRSA
jgi:hypothetical protein